MSAKPWKTALITGMFKYHTKCRVCGSSDLTSVADFGLTPLANDFRKPGEEVAGYAPLNVLFCQKCALAQLSVTVNPEVLYANYSYVSSTSETMLKHMDELIQDIRYHHDGQITTVLEIGSNTGVFLERFKPYCKILCGIDPAENLAREAEGRGVCVTTGLFNCKTAKNSLRADVVVARHVFAHIDDWHEFIAALDHVTNPDATVVIEVPYVCDMLERGEWDSVYHEHLSYVSIKSVNRLLINTPWFVSATKKYGVHGGSIAFFINRQPERLRPVECDSLSEYDFCQSSEAWKRNANVFWSELIRGEPKKIFGYGAPAKATLWTSYLKLDKRYIRFVHDNTPQKHGCLMPGTDIPVVSGTDGMADCDVGIVFAWNYFDEIKAKSPKEVSDKLVVPFRIR
jgi:SAM-dependent methyltransferase